jgi:hypothetical protein
MWHNVPRAVSSYSTGCVPFCFESRNFTTTILSFSKLPSQVYSYLLQQPSQYYSPNYIIDFPNFDLDVFQLNFYTDMRYLTVTRHGFSTHGAQMCFVRPTYRLKTLHQPRSGVLNLVLASTFYIGHCSLTYLETLELPLDILCLCSLAKSTTAVVFIDIKRLRTPGLDDEK